MRLHYQHAAARFVYSSVLCRAGIKEIEQDAAVPGTGRSCHVDRRLLQLRNHVSSRRLTFEDWELCITDVDSGQCGLLNVHH